MKRKAESANGQFIKFSTRTTACSQTHLDGERRKKKLSDRVHFDVTGPILHRDIFSSFLALQVENNQLPSVEELNLKFSGVEQSLIQAWLNSDEFNKKFSKLKPLVEARLSEISNPLRESESNLESAIQITIIDSEKVA